MSKQKKNKNHISDNEGFLNKGIALMMVMGTVAFLSALLADFIFNIQVNKLRAYNQQEKIQAKLNAESGLTLSLARLSLYQAALNLLEKNADKKKIITPEILNFSWSAPFVYPIPLGKDLDVIQRSAIEEFEKDSLLQGSLSVTIQNSSNLININLLRIPKKNSEGNDEEEKKASPFDVNANSDDIGTVDKRLIEMLKNKFEKEKLKDDKIFDEKYPLNDPELIIEIIKYFINDENSYDSPRKAEVESYYSDKGINPKYAPLSSISELYLIPGLSDSLIDLIKDEVTVHGLKSIDLNKINETVLRLMFPDINDEQVKEFFKYRDDPDKPHTFNSIDDFSNYIVNQAMIVGKEAFDKQIELFKKSGVVFGTTGLFFKVNSIGKFNRVTYTLTALVSIPAYTPPPPPKKKPIKVDGTCDAPYRPDENREFCLLPKKAAVPDGGEADGDPNSIGKTDENQKESITYLKPRVVELFVN